MTRDKLYEINEVMLMSYINFIINSYSYFILFLLFKYNKGV